MSSWIASDKHIASVVASLDPPLSNDEAQRVANLILRANIKSVNYRYQERTKFSPVEINTAMPLEPKQVISLCQSIDYQSCEHPSWAGSKAFGWVHYIASQAAWRLQRGAPNCMWII